MLLNKTPAFAGVLHFKTWMAGTLSAKTRFALLPGHEVVS
jgi:hypothetical protein